MSRVKDDPELLDEIGSGPKQIHRPIIVIHAHETGKQEYLLHLTELDKMMNDPRVWGIVLSDLVDHIASAYVQQTGRDERDIRETITRVMRDESRFKDKDPSRGRMRGATLMPKAN